MQDRFAQDGQASTPRHVLQFTGHMMDKPDRPQPRFPPSMEPAAAQRIAEALDRWDAGPRDLAYCQAAAGGDLLFLEACRQRAVPCQVLLPFDEQRFIEASIIPSAQRGDAPSWQARWEAVRATLDRPPRVMDAELGPTPPDQDPFERCNLWLLDSALAHGPGKLHLIALWNGQAGDGPGGTAHLKEVAEQHAGQVCWIDTRVLLP